MKNKVFYSWQSNLPNSSNRGFIEECIKSAIKVTSNNENIGLELNLERDTKGLLGTPDIVNSLFEKIDSSKLFIADISIINSNSTERKTPNPNVLLELGYAAKSLGWSRVLCFYNVDYGSIDDLPFDIRFRRIITYSLKNRTKGEVRRELAQIISTTIEELFYNRLLDDEINDFFKVKIDTQLITLLKSLSNIMYGYKCKENLFERLKGILNLNVSDIQKLLENKEFLGFQVFKNLRSIDKELELILKDFISSAYFNKELGIIVANIVKWIKKYNKFISIRETPDLFLSSGKVNSDFIFLDSQSINPNNKKTYVLLEKIDKENGMVIDFGDIQETTKKDRALESVYLNETYCPQYISYIDEILNLVKRWLDNTNGEFIIDNVESFEFREGEHPYLSVISNPMKESLYIVLNEKIDIDYYGLIKFNLVSVLKSYGYIFSNEKEIEKMIDRQTAIHFPLEKEISTLLEQPMVEEPIQLLQSYREKYEMFKNKQISIEKVYMPYHLVRQIKALLTLQASLEFEIVRSQIEDILNKLNENILVLMPNMISKFLIGFSDKEYAEIDIDLIAEEYESIRNYHEREFNLLNRKIIGLDITKSIMQN